MPKFATKSTDFAFGLVIDDGAIVQQQPDQYLELDAQITYRPHWPAHDPFSQRLQLVARRGPARPSGVVADLIADRI